MLCCVLLFFIGEMRLEFLNGRWENHSRISWGSLWKPGRWTLGNECVRHRFRALGMCLGYWVICLRSKPVAPHWINGYNNTCLTGWSWGCNWMMHVQVLGTELNLSSAIFGCVRNRCAVKWLGDVKVWWRMGPVALHCAFVSFPYIHIVFVFLLEEWFRLQSWSMVLLWSLTWSLEL